MDSTYYARDPSVGQGVVKSFITFDEGDFRGLDEHRKGRLASNRVSHVADLMKECTPSTFFGFDAYKETDLLLYLRSVIDLALSEEPGDWLGYTRRHIWYPRTRPYMDDSSRFELFDRIQQPRYQNAVKGVLGVNSKADFEERLRIGGDKLGEWFKQYGMGRFALQLAGKWVD